MVTSQDRLQNSPLYSVNTGLDSFILFNDEILDEQVTLTELMVNREEEVNTTEISKQFAEPLNFSKPNTGLELQIMRPSIFNLESKEIVPQNNEKLEELKQSQQSANTKEQSKRTLVEEDSNQDETETSPLWSMNFDGSCTRTNFGAGVWICNTENNHT